ncbi:uncharacterized protein [Blastocystis hominis]|uniref:Uncharacterized protein n=1 Tax=Blastocystis hominis TaxID=12968 RepID=D8LV98_BLAHO|nr:uncharacterized protein [Blastocystis hominis]CBK19737.2 unnamed protein product [Blastocystis hominis]|eukprot:XP_012893785.1 uncharacterized protein [Blastocystis hominis]
MQSLDDLNKRVEENTKANQVLLEENQTLRTDFRERVAKYQEQAELSKELIDKLTEANTSYEERLQEMAVLLRQANAKIMEGEEAKKTIAEYQELVKKQEEVIASTKENRENLSNLVKRYETVLKERNAEIKAKNKEISELQNEMSKMKKECARLKEQSRRLEALCRYLQEKQDSDFDPML